ncbi:hypothetical protein [Shewanella sp.]|uniref:hypothetical protein n=1 Tax=Shewanella sp. TaxID=50422 RepID=UPI0040475248
MNKIDTVDTSRGNTNSLDIKGRNWCFTLNNYTDTEYTSILSFCTKPGKLYIIGKEIGESGTPHLQGYISSKNAIRFNTLKSVCSRMHLEKAKGDGMANRKYCSKDGNYETNIPAPALTRHERLLKKYDNAKWKDWQQEIIDIVEGEIDDRKIYWFYEPTGNIGKSFLNKYLGLKYDAIICAGKKADVFNQVFTWFDKKENIDADPRLVLVDCPRVNMNYFNYSALEEIKNGMIFSGKYEGGVCYFEAPHVICFANSPPDTSTMSADRWVITQIGEKEEEFSEDNFF